MSACLLSAPGLCSAAEARVQVSVLVTIDPANRAIRSKLPDISSVLISSQSEEFRVLKRNADIRLRRRDDAEQRNRPSATVIVEPRF